MPRPNRERSVVELFSLQLGATGSALWVLNSYKLKCTRWSQAFTNDFVGKASKELVETCKHCTILYIGLVKNLQKSAYDNGCYGYPVVLNDYQQQDCVYKHKTLLLTRSEEKE